MQNSNKIKKYRPQRFSEIIGQDKLVTTLVNAIKFNRLGAAYLFSGSRGCGKTSIARIFAKALNCHHLGAGFEPCNECSSCKEITTSHSLDVLEIDGASNRGIDDIRTINETVGYNPSSGKYKIYIIDEVHMLTKEAFNALLKTLEEPPPTVKFFFATTEPHKIPATILSRCQRFQLARIPVEKIAEKLKKIALEIGVQIEEEASLLIAKNGEGSLRDAESLFDQIVSYKENNITVKCVSELLGFMPIETLFRLDLAGKKGDLAVAFEIAHEIFSQGKDIFHFVDSLVEHFRNILLTKLNPLSLATTVFSSEEREIYLKHEKYYSQEQCLDLLHFLIEAKRQMKESTSQEVALEAILLHILRSHQRISIETITTKLLQLEHSLKNTIPEPNPPPKPEPTPPPAPEPSPGPTSDPILPMIATPVKKGHVKGRDETIMRFAAVELEGTLKTTLN